MPTSVPARADDAQETLYVERMARVDGCPGCVINAEAPREIRPTSDGFEAAYMCTSCRTVWKTSWRDQ